jgi:murein tripeptide amidase MpaA
MMAAMLDGYDSDKTTHRLLKYFKWTFIPVLNVDGYEYSQTKDRMVWKFERNSNWRWSMYSWHYCLQWRKTRQSFENSNCIGVDLNRNWVSRFTHAQSMPLFYLALAYQPSSLGL